jgi:hypothetical protein
MAFAFLFPFQIERRRNEGMFPANNKAERVENRKAERPKPGMERPAFPSAPVTCQ